MLNRPPNVESTKKPGANRIYSKKLLGVTWSSQGIKKILRDITKNFLSIKSHREREKIFTFAFSQRKTVLCSTKASPTILQSVECKFSFLHFLKTRIFVLVWLFVALRKTNLYFKVGRSGSEVKLNVTKSQVQEKIKIKP